MKRNLIIALAICLVVIAAGGGAWWWQTQQPNKPTKTASTSPTPSINTDDNFLAIDRAPAINLPTVLANSFVIPAGTNMNKVITITTTGDIIPARGVDMQVRAHGVDYPLAGPGIKELLSAADMTIVDLEAPLIANCPVTKEGFTFCGQPGFASAMAASGIDVATLENNHVGNYGAAGIQETITHLTSAGLRYATADHVDIATIKGLKVGTLAFTGVGGSFKTDDIRQKVSQAKSQVDILLVAFHWGKEYELVPVADAAIAPDDPRTISRLAVDAGADVVIGNHPHWVQGVEIYKGKLISYALGNFIFDQSWSLPTQQGLVATYTFYGSKLIGMTTTPVHINNQAQPRIVDGAEKEQIMTQFQQSSQLMATSSATVAP